VNKTNAKSQREAVAEIMETNGGYITLQELYSKVIHVKGVSWDGTKDLEANIRCLLQRRKDFFKIKPGLWALESFRDKLPDNIKILIDEGLCDKSIQRDYTHYYYQGLIVDIGNLRDYTTYVPSQDKNRPYLDKTLKDVAKTVELPQFTFDKVIGVIKSIDVIWLNERNFPTNVFEVEHTTNFKNSLIKFYELKDFATEMTIVASDKNRTKYEDVINLGVFREIKNRVKFIDYNKIEQYCRSIRQMSLVNLS
jgi:hypothetical protein